MWQVDGWKGKRESNRKRTKRMRKEKRDNGERLDESDERKRRGG